MRAAALCLALLAAPAWIAPARAQVEQLEQVEPGPGERQFEAFAGPGGQRFELLASVLPGLVLGGEVELEDGAFDEAEIMLLLPLRDPEAAPVGLGVAAQAAIDAAGRFAGAEALLIVERRAPLWWLQANAILRHRRDEDGAGTGIAYSASAQRGLWGAWIGVEGSGRLARIGGRAAAAPVAEHYLGPSLTLAGDAGDTEIELGLAWMARVAGEGARSGPRAWIQLGF